MIRFSRFQGPATLLLASALLWSPVSSPAKERKADPSTGSGLTYSHFLNAVMLERYGEFNQALREYNRTLESDPSATLIYRMRANLHLKMGDPEKALADAQSYAKAHPGDVESLLLLANIHLFLNQRGAAQVILEKILQDRPDNGEALLTLATLKMPDAPVDAARLFEKFLKVEPESVEGYYNLGLLYQKLGDARSKKMFQKVIDLDPDSLPSLMLLGQMSERDGDAANAVKYYEGALEKAPDNFPLRMQLVLLYSQSKNMDQIARLLERYRDEPAAPLEANLWLGIVFEHNKQWRQALEHYQRAKKQSNLTELNIRLASLHSQMGQTKQALKALKEVIDKFPDNAQFRYFLGLAYLDVKKPKQGIRELERVVELKPEFSAAYFQMGAAYDTMRKWDQAERMFRQAIQVDTASASAYNYLGYTYADRNVRLDEARKLIERALELDQDNPAYLDSLGWLNFREGRLADAERQLNTAAERLPDPVVLDHLGDCQKALGKLSEAAQNYAKALELQPNNKSVRKKLKSMNDHLVPTSPSRRMLKQFEYNLSRASNISGALVFKNDLRWAPSFLSTTARGAFYLRKNDDVNLAAPVSPTELRIDLLDYLLVPAVTLRFQDRPRIQWDIYPPEFKAQLPAETESILDLTASFLNGKYIQDLDTPQTLVQEKSGAFVLTNGPMKVRLDKKKGTITEIELPGRTIHIDEFVEVDGILLPGRVTVQWREPSGKKAVKRELKIEFSRLSLKKIENNIFEVGERAAP